MTSAKTDPHTVLLRLGGRVPDAVLAAARLRLAETGTVEVPAAGDDVEFHFQPALPDPVLYGPHVPTALDLTGREPDDDVDRAAIRAAGRRPGAVALWRVWRFPPEELARANPPGRVFVLEANGAPAEDAAAVMRELVAAGVDAPQVEVYRAGDELTSYTRGARNHGALLWLAGGAPPIRIARVYDDDGRFRPGRERLSGDDVERVAAYLEAGAPILTTTMRQPDVVEPGRGDVVPMSFLTDGRWLWAESVAYYLRAYGLAADPELLSHVRAAGGRLPAPGPAEQHRAISLLFTSRGFAPEPED